VKHTEADLQLIANVRNAENAKLPGPYQHWYVLHNGYGPYLTCRWERVPLWARVSKRVVEWFGGEWIGPG